MVGCFPSHYKNCYIQIVRNQVVDLFLVPLSIWRLAPLLPGKKSMSPPQPIAYIKTDRSVYVVVVLYHTQVMTGYYGEMLISPWLRLKIAWFWPCSSISPQANMQEVSSSKARFISARPFHVQVLGQGKMVI